MACEGGNMRTWLITGCSTGIERGIAKAVLHSGDQAVVTARAISKIQEFETEYPDTCAALPLDLTDGNSMENAVKEAYSRFGKIDVLVNNAGYGYRAAIEESEDEEIDLLFRTNVFGPVKLMNLCLPKMREDNSGIIINVSSIGAVRAAVGNGFYSASKAALELVSDAVEKETEHLGIKVMIVEPGAFRTSFYDSLHGASRAISDYTPSVGSMRLENMVNNHDRKGDPDKAGKLIVELVSSGNLPKRLPLGSDAVRIIRDELKSRLAEVEKTESYSITTDY